MQEELFSELTDDMVSIDYRRQEIQTAYISILASAIEEQKNYKDVLIDDYYLYSEYSKSVFLSELESLKKLIIGNLKRFKDKTTQTHLIRCILRIDKILKK